jgi:hypothetical protein
MVVKSVLEKNILKFYDPRAPSEFLLTSSRKFVKSIIKQKMLSLKQYREWRCALNCDVEEIQSKQPRLKLYYFKDFGPIVYYIVALF